jgi:peptidoglycan/xylan/chitin deacetylase (PgdA/CDA1 family)
MIPELLLLILIITITGAAAFAYVYIDEARKPQLICLMYHRFVTTEEYKRCQNTEVIYSLPIEAFEDQLRGLKELGYRSVSVRQARDFLAGEAQLPQRAVLLTIDDGCRSALTRAEPLLRKYGFHATLFVTIDPTSSVFDRVHPDQARLTDDELRSLDPSIVDVQAHGITHRPLVTLSDEELRQELKGAGATLSRVLGRPVRYFAIPGNWYNRRVLQLAREAGYDAVFVSDAGGNQPGRDPMRIRRINVEGCADIDTFRANLLIKDAEDGRFHCSHVVGSCPFSLVVDHTRRVINAESRKHERCKKESGREDRPNV